MNADAFAPAQTATVPVVALPVRTPSSQLFAPGTRHTIAFDDSVLANSFAAARFATVAIVSLTMRADVSLARL
jgi:hypothetical protein